MNSITPRKARRRDRYQLVYFNDCLRLRRRRDEARLALSGETVGKSQAVIHGSGKTDQISNGRSAMPPPEGLVQAIHLLGVRRGIIAALSISCLWIDS